MMRDRQVYLVAEGTIDMTISSLESMLDRLSYFSRCRLPCTETDSRYGSTVVELEFCWD